MHAHIMHKSRTIHLPVKGTMMTKNIMPVGIDSTKTTKRTCKLKKKWLTFKDENIQIIQTIFRRN